MASKSFEVALTRTISQSLVGLTGDAGIEYPLAVGDNCGDVAKGSLMGRRRVIAIHSYNRSANLLNGLIAFSPQVETYRRSLTVLKSTKQDSMLGHPPTPLYNPVRKDPLAAIAIYGKDRP